MPVGSRFSGLPGGYALRLACPAHRLVYASQSRARIALGGETTPRLRFARRAVGCVAARLRVLHAPLHIAASGLPSEGRSRARVVLGALRLAHSAYGTGSHCLQGPRRASLHLCAGEGAVCDAPALRWGPPCGVSSHLAC